MKPTFTVSPPNPAGSVCLSAGWSLSLSLSLSLSPCFLFPSLSLSLSLSLSAYLEAEVREFGNSGIRDFEERGAGP